MNPSEIFYKGAAKNEPFGFFPSKGAAKTLRGQNPAILREGGVADKNGTTHHATISCLGQHQALFGMN